MKKYILLLLAVLVSVPSFAQFEKGGIEGRIVSRSGRIPVPQAEITVRNATGDILQTESGDDGTFLISGIPAGDYTLVVSAPGFATGRVQVEVEDYLKDIFFVSLQPEDIMMDMDDAMFADFDMDDGGYQHVPSTLSTSSDVFDNVAGYDFSQVRFRVRGFDSSTQDVYLSGVRLNDALTGYTPWSLWSGLNEATREKETVSGSALSDYGLGGFNGVTNILGTASSMRKGARFSVLTNSSFYRLRLMASYATGELDNGWSFAANVSTRLGGNDWIQGVYYRSFAYYLAAEKNINDIHRLSLSIFGSPVQRGAQNGSTQEVYDLVGSNYYNSNWGWQDGKIRNARVRNNHEPVAVLKYTFTPAYNWSLDATVVYRTGRNGYSALDWYDAPDPRPDYYRNLPSYMYMEEADYDKRDAEFQAGWATEAWLYNYNNTRHINWDRLYNVNYNSLDDNGNKRSKYIQEERRTDQNDLNLALSTKWISDDYFTVQGGVNFRWNRTEYYKIVKDLLGGDYYLNIDQFAERDFASDPIKIQNDLDYYLAHGEAQKLRQGDKYGYDYYANVRDANVWADFRFAKGGWAAFAAVQGGYNSFWRDGLVRKGLFPNNSLGKSEMAQFFTYRAKAGASYTYGPHRVYANAGYFNDAPYFAESFVSPRTRNTLTPNLTTQKTMSADLSYSFSKNGYRVRVTGYYARINDQTDLMSFYDDSQHSFTNFAMSGIDERHAGVELGFEIPLPVTGLSILGALNWGDYVYTSTPYVTQTVDNNGELVMDNLPVAYWKSNNIYKKDPATGSILTDAFGNAEVEKVQKHYVPSTPQVAASLGLSYRSPNYLFAGIDVQYFDKMYLDMNPLYRTDMAVMGPDHTWTPQEEEYMASQEQFPRQFVLNANIGKSWYIQRKYNIGISFELRNILNNQALRTGGYEQTRLIDSTNGERYYKFDSRYFYMYGINYMLNIYFRF